MADPVKADRQKRPYTKPAFEYEEVFETMALQCTKFANACNRQPGWDNKS